MKRTILILTVAFQVLLAVGAFAANWTHVGTSGFTKLTPSQLMDRNRITMNSMLKDEAGNIWITASYDDKVIPDQALYPFGSGVTIFKPNGSKIDVDVLAEGYDGCITKLVESKVSDGGDGAIYALQNFINIEWSAEVVQNRILRLKLQSDDTVTIDEIYTPGPITYWNTPENRLGGIAAGGDGNIYWTQNGVSGTWRYHFFWRYNVGTGEVEEAPNRDGLIAECASETHRMLDLEYLGHDQFAIVGAYYTSTWQCNPISWLTPFEGIPQNYNNPTWGRRYNTVNAYDPLRQKMWVAGRSENAWVEWRVAGAGGTIVDLGDGNQGIRMVTTDGAVNEYYTDQPGVPSAQQTGALRFMIEEDSGEDRTLMWLYGNAKRTTDGKALAVAVKTISGQLKLVDLYPTTGPAILADLGPVTLGAWNEIFMYIDAEAATCRCLWNGSEVYNGPIGYQSGKNYLSWFEWGSNLSGAGSCTVVYDWVVQAAGFVDPADIHTKHWLYLDGSKLPTAAPNALLSNIMTRFDGDMTGETIFNSGKKIGSAKVWHVNGYDELNTPEPGKRNNGAYWVSAMAVNPATGEAWMAWSGEASYSYDATDRVRTVPIEFPGTKPPFGDEGVPEPGAQIHSLMFQDGKVYALTCNLTTGAYNVYAADVPQPGPTSIAQMKKGPVGLAVSTDSPKLVTYPYFDFLDMSFYIEDDSRASGIRVVPMGNQPIGQVGQRAQVEGFLGIKDGELVIFATSVNLSSATDSLEPIAMNGRSVGGGQTGGQPAVYMGDATNYEECVGLNTTGLLIKVAGKLKQLDYDDEYVDDGSGYPIKIEFIDGTQGNDGDQIIVTGVSSIIWDGTRAYRSIKVRSADDIVLNP